jgi:hypothetical protein
MKRLDELLKELKEIIESSENRIAMSGVVPRFAVDQEVWIAKDSEWPNIKFNGFLIPKAETTIEECFEKEEVQQIIIEKKSYEKDSPIVVGYRFTRYYRYDNNIPEEKVYESLSEAIEKNKEEFAKAHVMRKQEKEYELKRKKEELERQQRALEEEKE